MGSGKIKAKDLKSINYTNDQSKSLAITIMSRHFKTVPKDEKLRILNDVKENPSQFLEHESLAPLALCFTERKELKTFEEFELMKSTGLLNIFGQKHIEHSAIRQMEMAMQLPVSVQGALMPDAHHGYGLPIGGVLATRNAVIPYGVGLDIGCRMSLVICNAGIDYLKRYEYQLKNPCRTTPILGSKAIWNFRRSMKCSTAQSLRRQLCCANFMAKL